MEGASASARERRSWFAAVVAVTARRERKRMFVLLIKKYNIFLGGRFPSQP